MDREDFMKCVNIIAHGIYGGEEQAKYYYNKMILKTSSLDIEPSIIESHSILS